MTSPTHDKASWLADAAPDELRRIVVALYRAHRLVSAITDLDVLLERILEESKQVAQAEACSLLLYDPDSEELYFQVALGESGDLQTLKREIRLKVGQGIAGAAAAARECVNVIDVGQDSRFYDFADQRSNFRTRNLLAVPLIDRDELVGVLEVVNKVGGAHFTGVDLHVMEMFSALTASALANARLIEKNLRAARLAALGQRDPGERRDQHRRPDRPGAEPGQSGVPAPELAGVQTLHGTHLEFRGRHACVFETARAHAAPL